MLAVTTVSVLSLDQSADFFYINLLTHYSTSRKRTKNQDWYSHSGKELFFWVFIRTLTYFEACGCGYYLVLTAQFPLIRQFWTREKPAPWSWISSSVVIPRSLTMRWLNDHNHITDRIVIVIAAIMIAIYSEEARFDLFEVVNSEKPPIRRVELIIDSWDFFLFKDSIINSSSRFNLAKTELRK